MMKSTLEALGKLNPRLVLGAGCLLVALILFEGWMLVLRKPFVAYQNIAASRVALSAALQQSVDTSGELGKMAAEVKQLSDLLSGELHLAASDDKMVASLMQALDQSAAAHGLTLISVKPGERKPVSVFEEVSFEVSAKGAYLQLCQWLLGFATTLGGNASITEFDMKTSNEAQQVTLTLKIALYRPLKPIEVAK